MPTNKHKRKASAHSKRKTAKKPKPFWLMSLHPKFFVLVGLFFVVLGIYLLIFESQNNSMFGLAMIAVVSGAVISVFANFAVPKKKTK